MLLCPLFSAVGLLSAVAYSCRLASFSLLRRFRLFLTSRNLHLQSSADLAPLEPIVSPVFQGSLHFCALGDHRTSKRSRCRPVAHVTPASPPLSSLRLSLKFSFCFRLRGAPPHPNRARVHRRFRPRFYVDASHRRSWFGCHVKEAEFPLFARLGLAMLPHVLSKDS